MPKCKDNANKLICSLIESAIDLDSGKFKRLSIKLINYKSKSTWNKWKQTNPPIESTLDPPYDEIQEILVLFTFCKIISNKNKKLSKRNKKLFFFF